MKAVKYLFALWAGLLVYVSLTIVFGAVGVSAYRQLEQEQKKQELNIEALMLINSELEETVNSLRYDRDTLAVLAREQSYASPSEKFIRIVGLGLNHKPRISTGDVLYAPEPQYTPDKTLRIIAFCTGISIFLCMCVFDFLKYLDSRR